MCSCTKTNTAAIQLLELFICSNICAVKAKGGKTFGELLDGEDCVSYKGN